MNDRNWDRMDLRPEINDVHRRWGWFLVMGIALVILGILAISASVMTTLLSVAFIGWLLAIGGAALVIHSFMTHHWRGFLSQMLIGLLYLGLGIMMIARPLASALSLTLVIAAFFIAGGLIRMIGALTMRVGHWGWVLLNGLISLLLGIMIWAHWPASGLWVIGMFVGIDMIFAGWSYIMLGSMARRPPALPA